MKKLIVPLAVLFIVLIVISTVSYIYSSQKQNYCWPYCESESISDAEGQTLKTAYCAQEFLEGKKRGDYDDKAYADTTTTSLINIDSDSEKELLGICTVYPYGINGGDQIYTLYIQDDAIQGSTTLYTKTDYSFQRYVPFDELETKDMDGDGMDEITYKTYGWYALGAGYSIYLYSPLHSKWYSINEKVEQDIDTEKITRTISFNDQAMPTIYKMELERRLNAWDKQAKF